MQGCVSTAYTHVGDTSEEDLFGLVAERGKQACCCVDVNGVVVVCAKYMFFPKPSFHIQKQGTVARPSVEMEARCSDSLGIFF